MFKSFYDLCSYSSPIQSSNPLVDNSASPLVVHQEQQFAEVTIAKHLIAGTSELQVSLKGVVWDYTTTSKDDSLILHFTYQHSTYEVVVSLGRLRIPFIETTRGMALVSGGIMSAIVIFTILLKRRPAN